MGRWKSLKQEKRTQMVMGSRMAGCAAADVRQLTLGSVTRLRSCWQ